jgi:hypothetical protein
VFVERSMLGSLAFGVLSSRSARIEQNDPTDVWIKSPASPGSSQNSVRRGARNAGIVLDAAVSDQGVQQLRMSIQSFDFSSPMFDRRTPWTPASLRGGFCRTRMHVQEAPGNFFSRKSSPSGAINQVRLLPNPRILTFCINL